MSKRALWSVMAGLALLAGLLLGCGGAPQVVVVTATPTATPPVQVIVVTPVPPTASLAPPSSPTPGPTALPEEMRIPVLSQVSLREEEGPDGITIYFEIPFRDADGDVNLVDYSIVAATFDDAWVEDGEVDIAPAVQQHGASASGSWTCSRSESTTTVEIVLRDAAGHVSAPQQVVLHCPGLPQTATPTPLPPTATRTPRPPTATPTRKPGPPTDTPEPIPTSPPPGTGVEGTMPKSIPCSPWEDNGCQWDFTVQFKELTGNPATITRIGRRFIDARGQEWTVGGLEWEDVDIFLYAGGGDSYSSWVRTEPGGGPDQPDLANGTVVVSWAGKYLSGEIFSGSASSRLAPP
jgi:hypothetical protein